MDADQCSIQRQGMPDLITEEEKVLDIRPNSLITPLNSPNIFDESQQLLQQNFNHNDLLSAMMAQSNQLHQLISGSVPSSSNTWSFNTSVPDMEVDMDSLAESMNKHVSISNNTTCEYASLDMDIDDGDDCSQFFPNISPNGSDCSYADKKMMHQAMIDSLLNRSIVDMLENSPRETVIQCINHVVEMAEQEENINSRWGPLSILIIWIVELRPYNNAKLGREIFPCAYLQDLLDNSLEDSELHEDTQLEEEFKEEVETVIDVLQKWLDH